MEGSDLEVRSSRREHECRFCGKKFSKAQSLGGHVSKMHPNMKSSDNSKRMKEAYSPLRMELE